jgi:lysozyme
VELKDVQALYVLLEKHEGNKSHPYTDTVGKVTIGIGRNLTDKGLSPAEVRFLFINDLNSAWEDCVAHIPGFDKMSDPRKYAFVDIMFNMGWSTFSTFHNTLAAVAAEDWNSVADHLADSKWDKQVGKRADELQQMIRNG